MRQGRWDGRQALESMGLYTPEQLHLETAGMRPVVVALDLSKSTATEPIEARGLFGDKIPQAAGLSSYHELLCLSAGGLVVESLTVSELGSSGNAESWFIVRDNEPVGSGPTYGFGRDLPPDGKGGISVGGRRVASEWRTGAADLANLVGDQGYIERRARGTDVDARGLRFWVPPGGA